MKTKVPLLLLFVLFESRLIALTQDASVSSPQPQHIQVSAKAAEKHLIQKVEICYASNHAWTARVIGTVVLAIEIDEGGNVQHPTFVSGPLMLRTPALDAVEKHYKYKPFLQNGRAVEAKTTVSVFVGLQCHSSTPYWIN